MYTVQQQQQSTTIVLPVFLNGKSESNLAVAVGTWGILYGWELADAPPAPAGNDSPEELFTTPLELKELYQ